MALWTARGYKINVQTPPDDRQYFFAAIEGVRVKADGPLHCCFARSQKGHHLYPLQPTNHFPTIGCDWICNKLAFNLTQPPLPNIGKVETLWKEYLAIKPTLRTVLSDESKSEIDDWLQKISAPLIILHTRGNTSKQNKDFSSELEIETYKALLERTDAVCFLLDWDNRVERYPSSNRVIHMSDNWRKLTLPEVAYLMEISSYGIYIDSGPLHMLEKWTTAKALGCWHRHHPSHYSIPSHVTHLVDTEMKFPHWNENRKDSYNIISASVTGEKIAELVAEKIS